MTGFMERDVAEQTAEDGFEKECTALANTLTVRLYGAPKAVAICVLPAVMAAVAKTFGVPPKFFISAFLSALEDMKESSS